MALKPHWFHILLALSEGATNGAEIRRRVRGHTDGALKLYPAMLYGSLDDLQEREMIRETDRPTGDHERYRYYRLTPAGRKELGAETQRLEKVVRIARDLLAPRRSR